MDNEHAEKLLVAMVKLHCEHAEKVLLALGKLTDAIERLNQRLPQPTGQIECFGDGSTREIMSNERHFFIDGMARSD
jgi:hypothetical protein